MGFEGFDEGLVLKPFNQRPGAEEHVSSQISDLVLTEELQKQMDRSGEPDPDGEISPPDVKTVPKTPEIGD